MQMRRGNVVTVAAELLAALDFPALVFPAKAGTHFCRGHRPSPV
jgi:hypothetical protein